MSGANQYDPEYIAARRVLLDAIEALGTNRKAVILVGAQAIYLHTGESNLAVAPYTTDADLVLDPSKLKDKPDLSSVMKNAGFELTIKPGTWTKKIDEVDVDFLVPTSLAGSGRRGARLGVHGNEFARKSNGLEATIVDNTLLQISSFEDTDRRCFDILVAGVAALLIAKLHKIAERQNDNDRLQNKDALDILRILRSSETDSLAATLKNLSAHQMCSKVTLESRSFLKTLFSNRNAIGSQMVVRASSGLEDGDFVAMSCEVLSRRLLEKWQ
jgi:hypothetical protein